jgi:glycine dehydrogenase subunit 2
MDEVTFQPRGGGHGAFTDACMIRAYHHARGDDHRD